MAGSAGFNPNAQPFAPPSPALSHTPSVMSTATSTSKVRLVECGPMMGSGSRMFGGRKPGGAAAHHVGWACTPTGQRVPVMSSTASHLPNRERDKLRVETTLGLPEFGDATTEFYAAGSGLLPVALGYDRIVYGDHGPYVEFSEHQICWSTFPVFIEKPVTCFFDECWTADMVTMLYAQKRHVTNKPNPPSGEWAVQNNRPEGYANYLVGRYYLACEVGTIAVRFSAESAAARRRRKKALKGDDDGGPDSEGKGKGGKGKGKGNIGKAKTDPEKELEAATQLEVGETVPEETEQDEVSDNDDGKKESADSPQPVLAPEGNASTTARTNSESGDEGEQQEEAGEEASESEASHKGKGKGKGKGKKGTEKEKTKAKSSKKEKGPAKGKSKGKDKKGGELEETNADEDESWEEDWWASPWWEASWWGPADWWGEDDSWWWWEGAAGDEEEGAEGEKGEEDGEHNADEGVVAATEEDGEDKSPSATLQHDDECPGVDDKGEAEETCRENEVEKPTQDRADKDEDEEGTAHAAEAENLKGKAKSDEDEEGHDEEKHTENEENEAENVEVEDEGGDGEHYEGDSWGWEAWGSGWGSWWDGAWEESAWGSSSAAASIGRSRRRRRREGKGKGKGEAEEQTDEGGKSAGKGSRSKGRKAGASTGSKWKCVLEEPEAGSPEPGPSQEKPIESLDPALGKPQVEAPNFAEASPNEPKISAGPTVAECSSDQGGAE